MMKENPPFFLEIQITSNEQDSKSAYNDIYADEGLSQLPSFYLWFLEKTNLSRGRRLLDVSCGAGEIIQLAKQQGIEAYGIDISYQAAQRALQNSSQRVPVCTGAGEFLPYAANSFDYVTNVGSLEHFLSPAQGVQEMARVLNHKGKAFVLVPNTFSLTSNILYAWKTGETSIDNQPIQRYAARMDWHRLLEQNGLRVYKTIKYERPLPRIKADWRYYWQHPKDFVRALIAPLIPLNLAFCFVFFCEKKS